MGAGFQLGRAFAYKLSLLRTVTNHLPMKGPKIELSAYQRFIDGLMHLFIIVVLLGIFLKVLVF